MLLIFRICVGLAILVVIVHGNDEKDLKELDNRLKDIMKLNQQIDGFELRKRISSESFVYRGKRIADNETVTIKFAAGKGVNRLFREHEVYTYLHAIEKPTNVEQFGIPTVYYCNKWEKFGLLVLSYLNGRDLIGHAKINHFIDPVNSLIIFRDFVILSKYMHSCGVRHDDIKPENIIIDNKGRTFLFDFDVSCRLNEYGNGATLAYASRQYHRNLTRDAVSDWESFLYTMCYINFIQLDWLFPNDKEDYIHVLHEKYNIEKTIAIIQNKKFKSEHLKKVMLAFAHEVFNNDSKFPDYDAMYTLICQEIEKMQENPKTARFKWIIEPDETDVPDIKKIISPKSIDFDTFSYPKVDRSNFRV